MLSFSEIRNTEKGLGLPRRGGTKVIFGHTKCKRSVGHPSRGAQEVLGLMGMERR